MRPCLKVFVFYWANEQEEEEEKTSFTVDEMEEILADRKSKWQVRNNVLIFLQKYAETLSDEEFHSMMEKIIESMSFQVQTRQSAVARYVSRLFTAWFSLHHYFQDIFKTKDYLSLWLKIYDCYSKWNNILFTSTVDEKKTVESSYL